MENLSKLGKTSSTPNKQNLKRGNLAKKTAL